MSTTELLLTLASISTGLFAMIIGAYMTLLKQSVNERISELARSCDSRDKSVLVRLKALDDKNEHAVRRTEVEDIVRAETVPNNIQVAALVKTIDKLTKELMSVREMLLHVSFKQNNTDR